MSLKWLKAIKNLTWLAIVLLPAICLHCDRDTIAEKESYLGIAVRADITGIYPNPPIQSEAFTMDLNSNVFEGLVRFGKNMNPEAAIAESWETVDDHTWLFRLRKGLQFSNGDPVRAEDVVASLQAALDRPFVSGSFMQSVRTVRAAGFGRVEIKTHHPNPLLLSQLAFGFVLPKKLLYEKQVPAIGTGPYAIESWKPAKELVLVKNRYFRGPGPAFNRVRFLVEPDAKKRVNAVLEEKVQIADYIPVEEIDRLQSMQKIKIISRPGTRVIFLSFRMDRKPFSDERLRKAIELTIDRQEMINRALAGRATVASQLVPPQVAGYNPEIKIPKTDRSLARKLIAEAGYADGLSINIDGTKDRYLNDVQILHEIARQLKSVGIKATVNAMPKLEFFPYIASGKSDFTLVGFSCENLYAGLALDTIIRSPKPGTKSSQNHQGLADAELDQLIDQAQQEPLLKSRTAIYAKALKRIADIRAIVPLEIQTETIAMSRKIEWEPPTTFGLRIYDAEPAGK